MYPSTKQIFDVLSEAELALKATPKAETIVYNNQRLHALRRVAVLRDQLRDQLLAESEVPAVAGGITSSELSVPNWFSDENLA